LATLTNECAVAVAVLTSPLHVETVKDLDKTLPASYLRTSVSAQLLVERFDPSKPRRYLGSAGGSFHSPPKYYALKAGETASIPVIGSADLLDSLQSGLWLATIHTFGAPLGSSPKTREPFAVSPPSTTDNRDDRHSVVLGSAAELITTTGTTFKVE